MAAMIELFLTIYFVTIAVRLAYVLGKSKGWDESCEFLREIAERELKRLRQEDDELVSADVEPDGFCAWDKRREDK